MTDIYEDIQEVETSNSEVDIVDMFGEREARWFQVAVKNAVEKILTKTKKTKNVRILVHLPTGSGKTLTSGLILLSSTIKSVLAQEGKPLRVLFVTHKHRLRTQAEDTFAAERSIQTINDKNLSKSSMHRESTVNGPGLVQIYYQSVFSDIPENLVYDLVILDECHHEACSSIQYKLDTLGNCPIIGMTATPDRADGCLIKFEEIISPISRQQAVDEGWLAPTHLHTFVDTPSKDKINILTDILINYGEQMGQTMIFVKTKKEVAALTDLLDSLGYVAIGLLDQNDREVNSALNLFSEGWVQFLVNCNKINEGVDVVGCTDVLLGRQYGSYSQLNQCIGRAARPDSPCNVWELVHPLSDRNLDTTVIVGTPESHRLVSKEGGKWVERSFDYITHRTNKQLGIASGVRVIHH